MKFTGIDIDPKAKQISHCWGVSP